MIAAISLIAACSPTKPPVDQLDAASRALGVARDAGAAQAATAEYRAAGRHFDQAQAAESQEDYDEAAQYALQSLADSEFATARARLAKTRAQVAKLKQQNGELKRDLATSGAPEDQP